MALSEGKCTRVLLVTARHGALLGSDSLLETSTFPFISQFLAPSFSYLDLVLGTCLYEVV